VAAWAVLEDVAMDAMATAHGLVATTSARRVAEHLGVTPGTGPLRCAACANGACWITSALSVLTVASVFPCIASISSTAWRYDRVSSHQVRELHMW
jgi:hypothetical protein